jgi:3-carboxy-cis,cis-muconate cycloisomerase
MAGDVAHLASTEVGEVSEPHVPGRGGSSAMPHKRNPVSSTVILAAHAAARGHATVLLDAMAAAHERPAGLWHAEWHALPSLFGLASGALREGRALAEGLVVHPDRMKANLDLTHGLLFAEAAAARLSPHLGAEEAHALVERAAGRVRDGADNLKAALAELTPHAVDDAFDLSPAIAAAGPWIDRALAEAARIRTTLNVR